MVIDSTAFSFKKYEEETDLSHRETIGGTEDPRIIRVNGTFYVTYTAYNNDTAQLALATSEDMINWKKYPPLFPGYSKSPFCHLIDIS